MDNTLTPCCVTERSYSEVTGHVRQAPSVVLRAKDSGGIWPACQLLVTREGVPPLTCDSVMSFLPRNSSLLSCWMLLFSNFSISF